MEPLDAAGARQARSGLTLIELMVVLGITAALVSLALPSLSAQVSRQRLKNTAETLAADLAEARFDAARRGSAVHVHLHPGTGWCWAVATAPGCDCRVPQQACQIKTVRSAEHPGVGLVEGQDALFDPATGAAGASAQTGSALLRSTRGDELQVGLTRLGRVRVCAPQNAALGYAHC